MIPHRETTLLTTGIATCLMLSVWVASISGQETPVETAIAYLSQEVPAWSRDANCFSCHNNGDAARALYMARSLGYDVTEEVLGDTTGWLRDPAGWENAPGEPGFNDKKLARIQFGSALRDAVETGALDDRGPLLEAARMLAADQRPDGSWHVEGDDRMLASPATYGSALATYTARRTLEVADREQFRESILRADAWFLELRLGPIMDAAAKVMALADRGEESGNQLAEAVGWIVDGQASDGGWGPYPRTPSEVFDTAVALLGLSSLPFDDERIAEAVSKGRAYLIETQLSDGGWIETTRPSGNQSYAEHISTSGWATLALLTTGEP